MFAHLIPDSLQVPFQCLQIKRAPHTDGLPGHTYTPGTWLWVQPETPRGGATEQQVPWVCATGSHTVAL
jgi:hypothetical protein